MHPHPQMGTETGPHRVKCFRIKPRGIRLEPFVNRPGVFTLNSVNTSLDKTRCDAISYIFIMTWIQTTEYLEGAIGVNIRLI